jgi:predicted nucleic-acid-binding Zn-ribbon protein
MPSKDEGRKAGAMNSTKQCPHCGNEIETTQPVCPHCGKHQIVQKSLSPVAAGGRKEVSSEAKTLGVVSVFCGVIGLFAFGIPLGIIAIVCGIPAYLKGAQSGIIGVVFGILSIIFAIGMLASYGF